jgi:hypothetical protein
MLNFSESGRFSFLQIEMELAMCNILHIFFSDCEAFLQLNFWTDLEINVKLFSWRFNLKMFLELYGEQCDKDIEIFSNIFG